MERGSGFASVVNGRMLAASGAWRLFPLFAVLVDARAALFFKTSSDQWHQPGWTPSNKRPILGWFTGNGYDGLKPAILLVPGCCRMHYGMRQARADRSGSICKGAHGTKG